MERPQPAFFQNVFRQMAGVDLRSLAVFRIGLAVVLLWDLSLGLASMREFYSDDGFLPLAALAQFQESPWFWSVHTLSGSVKWEMTLLVLHIVAAACVLIGFRTQIATIICWALISSLQVRNPGILHSGDAAMRLLFFWGMFLPLGARWSVDQSRGRFAAFTSDDTVAGVPGLALMLQVCFIYWMGVAMKTGPEWTRDGTAVYYALSLDQFVTPAGKALLRYPVFCHWATFGTWWLEVIGPALAFVPFRTCAWRLIAVASFWSLHIGLWVSLRLGPFPLTMIAGWAAFLPACFWRALGVRGAAASSPSPSSASSWLTGRTVQGVTLLCLIYALMWNLRAIDFKRWNPWFPQWMNPPGYVLQLQQYWPMFAPNPTTDDGWLVMEAELADGAHVDLLRAGRPVTFDKPAVISAEFRDTKWQKLLVNLWRSPYQKMRPLVANRLSFEWNDSHGAAQQIKTWTLWYMREDTLPDYEPPVVEKVEILRPGGRG